MVIHTMQIAANIVVTLLWKQLRRAQPAGVQLLKSFKYI